ncbi:uncharacterized protein [Dermacentor albipictus]|uniref:uncharacterized protein isoform X1 n=1 Tax=Dermacentor albipictus TaxID=60249 RepID=UPI0038FCE7D1
MAQACSEDDLSGGKTYSIVLFEDEDEVSVVPTSWISENTVRWPPFKSTAKITTAIKEQQPPSSDWTSYRCRVLWTCGSYESARQKEQQAEFTSDLASDVETIQQRRKRRPPARLESSDEESIDFPVPLRGQCFNSSQQTAKFVSRPPPPKIVKLSRFKPQSLASQDPQIQKAPPSREVALDDGDSFAEKRKLDQNAMLGKLLKEVKGIRAQVDGLEKSIQRIEQAITENKQPCAQPVSSAILELLPLATHQRLEELQWQLHDEKNRTDLMAHLSRIGGTSVQDSVRKIMRRCMCDTLAQDFSLTGRKGKRPFIGLYLLQVLTETLKSNFAQATESQIHLSIAEWLRYAPSRQKKRDAASPLMS